MSVQTKQDERIQDPAVEGAAKLEGSRNPDATDECNKAHVAETSRLEDADEACFDSIG